MKPWYMAFTTLCLLVVTSPSCKTVPATRVKTLPEAPLLDIFAEELPYNKSLTAKFKDSGFDFTVNPSRLQMDVPLESPFALLSRFGTPTFGTVNALAEGVAVGYFHEALDFARVRADQSPAVRAPVSGMAAVVFDCAPGESDCVTPSDYATSVVIHDDVSHALVGMLHVRPTPALLNASGFVRVTKGAIIGVLGAIEGSVLGDKPEWRHTHLMAMDFQKGTFINPSRHFSGYADTKAPTILGVRLFDENAVLASSPKTGKYDIVVDAFDSDDHSSFNREIAGMSLSVRDQTGRVLFQLPRCAFDGFLFQPRLQLRSPLFALDAAEIINGLKDHPTNTLQKDIHFGYAPTNLRVGLDGTCSVIEDGAGFVVIPQTASMITADVTVFDHFDNQTRRVFSFSVAR